MKKLLVLVISLIMLLGTVSIASAWGVDTSCKTKYPIVLVHGAFMRDSNMLGINYWWGIPAALRAKGAVLYVTNQDPFNSEAVRAQAVANELGVQYALAGGPLYHFTKINIIAHSMGPLDSRNVIANYAIPGVCAAGACNAKVATLTSISGTHTGSEVADVLWTLQTGIPILGPIVGYVIEEMIDAIGGWFFLIQGQNTLALLKDLLTTTITKVFNPNTPNQPGVLYQAYGGKMNFGSLITDPTGLVSDLLWAVMKAGGAGDNDGLVSLDSARIPSLCAAGKTCIAPVWRGAMTTSFLYPGVNHFAEIDHFLGIHAGWDAKGFYVNVAKDLKAKGY
jgi:triacylglycerol lipase